MSEAIDKTTVGLTPEGWNHMEALMETGWFAEQLDAYRLAISVALARQLPIDPAGLSGVVTKWNRGSLEPDGRVRALILAFAQTGRPYAHAEALADAGIRYLRRRLVDEHALLAEVIREAPA